LLNIDVPEASGDYLWLREVEVSPETTRHYFKSSAMVAMMTSRL